MARQNYLQRRGARYWTRIRIPSDLLSAFDGRKEIVQALGTSDPIIARQGCIDVTISINDLFFRIRNEMDDNVRRAIARQFYDEELRKDDARRYGGTKKGENHFRAKAIRQALTNALSMIATGDHGGDALFDQKTREAISGFGLTVEPGSADFVQVRSAIQRAFQEAYRAQIERDKGNFGHCPTDPLLSAPTAPVPVAAPAVAQTPPGASDETAHKLFAEYAKENPNGVAADNIAEASKSFALFSQVFPDSRFLAASISKKEVRAFRALLEGYPRRAADTNEFKGLSFKQIVEKNKQIGKPCIAVQTLNKHLNHIGSFCAWLVREGIMPSNPFDGMRKHLDKDEQKRFPFSSDQLNQLFQSPLYRGCEDGKRWHKAGVNRFTDHRYWAPLVGLFSGMRLGEIAQLEIADVREAEGVLVFDVNRNDGKSTKNKNSVRVVPVHKTLIDKGFERYIAMMKEARECLLFPLLEANERGQFAGAYSRDFGRFLPKIGVKGVSFHSFRHGVADALRRAGYLDGETALILGHLREVVTTARYGSLASGTVTKRAEMINKIAYAGVVLPDPWKW